MRKKFIGFLPVASPMRKLQVVQVAGVSTFCYRDDMVNTGAERVRISVLILIHWLATNTTNSLCCIDLLFVSLEGKPVRTVLVWPISFGSHDTPPEDP